jgi:hypothetical protein
MKTARTQHHGEEDGLRVVTNRIAEFVDVHGVDFDAGVSEEAVDDQDDAGEAIPGRQEMLSGHRRGRVVSLEQVGDPECDEDRCRDQRPDPRPV